MQEANPEFVRLLPHYFSLGLWQVQSLWVRQSLLRRRPSETGEHSLYFRENYYGGQLWSGTTTVRATQLTASDGATITQSTYFHKCIQLEKSPKMSVLEMTIVVYRSLYTAAWLLKVSSKKNKKYKKMN